MPFYEATKGRGNFVISFYPDPKQEFGGFARGYHRAAQIIVDHLLSRAGLRDNDAYPAVFLYRYAFELYLKNIHYNGALLAAFRNVQDLDAKMHCNHNLVALAKSASAILRRLFPQDQELDRFCLEMAIVATEFTEIDPASMSYRYPINKDGDASTRHHQVVSLVSLRSTMDRILDGLDTVDFGIQINTDEAQVLWEILRAVELGKPIP